MGAKSLACAQRIVEQHQAQFGVAPTPMKLLKLVYLAHAYMLSVKGKPLLDEPVLNRQYGPLVSSVYQDVRHYGDKPVKIVPSHDMRTHLNAEEDAIIDQVVRQFGRFTAITLSSAMHVPGTPWSISQASDLDVIPNTMIYQFYRKNMEQRVFSSL
jgi:uncharacterized phage-associated protein